MSIGIVAPISTVGGPIKSAESATSIAKSIPQARGERLHRVEVERERERVQADARLDESVAAQQACGRGVGAPALHQPAREPTEQRIARRHAGEEDRQLRGGRIAMRPEQRREIFLPRHLVDEAGGAGERGEEQGETARQRVSRAARA
ncbi:MAG: hypothetical protein E6J87_21715 [Deltaproteobacteria bacterium]|nr:MAG: hypothetical protein E6J87_21715 [Deltaproteobacteria bacterium]